jgi:hypothetical protein
LCDQLCRLSCGDAAASAAEQRRRE